jgi:hypothetical protein
MDAVSLWSSWLFHLAQYVHDWSILSMKRLVQ